MRHHRRAWGPTSLVAAAFGLSLLPGAKPVTLEFSGYSWAVKTSSGTVGPGPNYYSDSPANVWVDDRKRLHLQITKTQGQWRCAEVVCTKSLGYGVYRFYLDSAVERLAPNVVLGLFTWNDRPAF